MKSNEPENDERLRTVLRQWVVDAPLPPRFQDQVWKRIDRAEARPQPGFWTNLVRLFESALPRPKIAFSYIVTLLVLGVTAGSVAAQIKSGHLNTALSERYVQLVDPYHTGVSQP
jgi:hypothetical protein